MRLRALVLTLFACGGPHAVDAPMTTAVDGGPRAEPIAEPEPEAPPAIGIAWRVDEALAVHEARASGKPLLVQFFAAWCRGCVQLEQETFADPEVRAATSRWVALRIDATDDEEIEANRLKRKYDCVGLPCVRLVDARGRELQRFNEFVPPDRMLASMRAARP